MDSQLGWDGRLSFPGRCWHWFWCWAAHQADTWQGVSVAGCSRQSHSALGPTSPWTESTENNNHIVCCLERTLYLYSLLSNKRNCVTETIGYLRKDLIANCRLLKVIDKVLHLKERVANDWHSWHAIIQLTCCNRFSLVALSFEEKSLTTQGTIFFW